MGLSDAAEAPVGAVIKAAQTVWPKIKSFRLWAWIISLCLDCHDAIRVFFTASNSQTCREVMWETTGPFASSMIAGLA